VHELGRPSPRTAATRSSDRAELLPDRVPERVEVPPRRLALVLRPHPGRQQLADPVTRQPGPSADLPRRQPVDPGAFASSTPAAPPQPTLRARRSATIGRESKARRTVRPSATGGPLLDPRRQRATLAADSLPHRGAALMNRPAARPAPAATRAITHPRPYQFSMRREGCAFSANSSWLVYGRWHRELKVHSRRLLLY
jgi:hypothetical protein